MRLSIAQVIEDPEYPVGFGADPENPKAIAEAINAVFRNMDRYETFRKNALWLAENRYRYDRESKPLVEIYERLAQ